MEKSCLETLSHPISLLSFPFALSPPPSSNPTLQIHKLQTLQPCQQQHGGVQRGKKGQPCPKNLLVVLDLLNAQQRERRIIWSIFLGTGLAGVTRRALEQSLPARKPGFFLALCSGSLGLPRLCFVDLCTVNSSMRELLL